MALQIRRGPTADRMSYTPVVGELIWDTSTNSLYIGNGTTAGGLPAGTLVTEDVQDIASTMLVNGTHQNITFTYDDTLGRINSTFDLSSFNGTISADGFIGSHYANDSTLLLNAATGAVNLNGTVKGNIIPDADIAYDLGSASYRFRDLYLSGSSIKLGNATITSTGTAVNLPAGSTINGVVPGAGVEAGMNYNINIVGDDSTTIINATTKAVNAASLTIGSAVSLPAGSTLNGTAFGFRVATEDSTNVAISNGSTLEIRGDQGIQTRLGVGGVVYISADITAVRPEIRNDSTPAYMTFVGNTSAASYIGTDTSLRYIASTGTLETLSIISGVSINSPLIGTTDILTQTVTSNGVLIISSTFNDGSANTHLVSVGSATGDGRLQIVNNTYSGSNGLVNILQAHSTADSRNFQFNRSRGTTSVPVVVNNGDDIIDIAFAGYDGSAYQVRAAIAATIDGAVSAGNLPTKIDFLTGTTAAGVAVSIGSNRQTTFNGAIKLAVYADNAARDAAITSPSAGMMVFNTTGTKFQGYTGSAWVDLN